MLSIITPVYNGERFIESCIQVVINQVCSSIEHIIVDGGSTDQTVKIIKQYAEHYPHIRWISEKDKGQSDAMNKGIAMARGEVIGILNVDDYYEPNVLCRIYQLMKFLPQPSLIVGNCNVWDDENNLLFVNKPAKLKINELLLGNEINHHPVNPSAYFYHVSLHQKIGFYDVHEHYALDLDFLFRAVQQAKVKYINETWGNYRLIKGTKTFNDIKSGQCVKRMEKILRRHRNQLPLLQKWLITTNYQLCKNEIYQKVKRKLFIKIGS